MGWNWVGWHGKPLLQQAEFWVGLWKWWEVRDVWWGRITVQGMGRNLWSLTSQIKEDKPPSLALQLLSWSCRLS